MSGGGLAIYDPSTAPEKVTFKRLMQHIEDRLHLAPPFRRRVVMVPFDADYPVVDRRRGLRHRVPCPAHRPPAAGGLAPAVHPVCPPHQPAARPVQAVVGDVRHRRAGSREGVPARLLRRPEQGAPRRRGRGVGYRDRHRHAGPQPGCAAAPAAVGGVAAASPNRRPPSCWLAPTGTAATQPWRLLETWTSTGMADRLRQAAAAQSAAPPPAPVPAHAGSTRRCRATGWSMG